MDLFSWLFCTIVGLGLLGLTAGLGALFLLILRLEKQVNQLSEEVGTLRQSTAADEAKPSKLKTVWD